MSNLTKQLLNTVLQDVTDFYVSDSTVYLNRTDVISANHCTAFGNFEQSINIYELAHKNLKQWAKFKNVFDKIDWSEEPEQIFKKAEELRNEID
jgi:CMP-N-acetylneuraminic acid synthetase